MPEHRNGEISGESERIESLAQTGPAKEQEIPAELDTGPPKMRRPSGKLGRHKVSFDWSTIDRYAAAPQLSSDLLRLACAALSAEELSEWICRHCASRKEGSYAQDTMPRSASASSAIYSLATAGLWRPSELTWPCSDSGPGSMTCRTDASGGIQGETTSAELYSEFKAVGGLCVVRRHGQDKVQPALHLRSAGPAKRIEAWLYESNRDPGCLRHGRNPFKKPLSEVLAGMPPENSEDEPQ